MGKAHYVSVNVVVKNQRNTGEVDVGGVGPCLVFGLCEISLCMGTQIATDATNIVAFKNTLIKQSEM